MELWVWLVLYVLVFVLFQILVYRYFHDDDGASMSNSTSGETSQFGQPQDGHQTPRSVERTTNERRKTDDASARRCPHCGTENDSSYTYCRDCVSPLSM